jgi:hypothetical protein
MNKLIENQRDKLLNQENKGKISYKLEYFQIV